MRNLKVFMSYNGTRYNGYQSQPCGNTVQDVVENRASNLLNQPISINGRSCKAVLLQFSYGRSRKHNRL